MKLKAKLKLKDIQDSENVNELLKDKDSEIVGLQVTRGYEADKSSRQRWETKMEDATKLALQVSEEKTYPWPNAANVKFPLITIASMQFAARSYPALVKAPDLVKFRVQGADDGTKASRAHRISSHMSYQLLEEDEGWEEHQDKLLLALPILGCAFKKSYYDKVKGHNCSTLVLPKDLVVNYYARSMECERKTEVFQLSPREIKERQLRGVYSDVEFTGYDIEQPEDSHRRQGIAPPADDSDRPRTLLESHCFIDLDGDGYKEPYVVTIDKNTSKVLRIVHRFGEITTEQSIKISEIQKRMKAYVEGLNPNPQTVQEEQALIIAESTVERMQAEVDMLTQQKPKVLKIKPIEHYTKYSFIPSPDGGFYDLGFGALLGPLNDSVNTLINQLIDSGSLANGSSGFIGKGARIKGGKVRFSPNEWKRVSVAGSTLRDSLVPLPVTAPSPVLFNLLSLLINYSERVGSVTDAMSGQNTPAYNMSQMLEQGLQVFNGVFKRVYRSMRNEFRKLYNLNAIYLDEESYFSYQDSDSAILRTDYTGDSKDLMPAADPSAFSNKEKMEKASMILERSRMSPGYNPIEVERRFLEAADIPDVNQIFPLQQNQETGQMEYVFAPQPDPELEIKKADMERRTIEGKARAETQAAVAEAKIMESEANIIIKMRELDIKEDANEIKKLEIILRELQDKRKALTEIEKLDSQEKIASEQQPSNEGTSS